MILEAKRNENILYNDGDSVLGSPIFPFYVSVFDDNYFNSKLISGTTDNGVEIYFEIDATILDFVKTELNIAGLDSEAMLNGVRGSVFAKLLLGPVISYYDQNSYRDIASSCAIDLVPGELNTFKYSELSQALSDHLAKSTSGGELDLGYARVCFYLDIARYSNLCVEQGTIDPNENFIFPYDIKINNLYMQKLVIPYIEPPRISTSSIKNYIDDKVITFESAVSITDKKNNSVTEGTSYSFTDNYGTSRTMNGYKFKPTVQDLNDPLINYLKVNAGPHNLRIMNPQNSLPTGTTLGVFKVTVNKFTSGINMYLIDLEYSDSPTNYGLSQYPISLKGRQMNTGDFEFFGGMVTYVKKSDLIALGVTEDFLSSYDTNGKFDLVHNDGTVEIAYRIPSSQFRYHDANYLSILDKVFLINPDATIDVYASGFANYWNTYLCTRTGPDQWGTYAYTPSADAMNIITCTLGIEIAISTVDAFEMNNKMETVFELSEVKEVAYLQVGTSIKYGSSGEYACYRIYASKDNKVWDYLGDSVGMTKTVESNEYYQYLSIDISNIAEPDPTKTYSKIKGKVLKVTIPDNNMYLRNTTIGSIAVIDGSKEFAIRDIVINNSGTILDFELHGLTKLTYKGVVYENEAADTKFTQLLKDTDFVNIDFSDLKAEGSELLIDLGSEKEFDTVNIITGRTTTNGIQEMKYSVKISSDGTTFTDVISMDPATFTEEMFLKRTGMLVMNSNCFFTDDV